MAPLAIVSQIEQQWFTKVPEVARFMTSAGLGNIVFFSVDQSLYENIIQPYCAGYGAPKFLKQNKESVSFFVSYLIQILAQHFFNAFFVYGLGTISTLDRYVATLVLTYSSYCFSLFGSTICNVLLLRKGVGKNTAFWGTVFGFGIFNFFVLRFLIGGTVSETSKATNKKVNRKNNRNKQKGLIKANKRRLAANRKKRNINRMRGGADDSFERSIFAVGSSDDPIRAFIKSIGDGVSVRNY